MHAYNEHAVEGVPVEREGTVEAVRPIYPPTFPTCEQREPIVCSSILRGATKRRFVIVPRSRRYISERRNVQMTELILIVILMPINPGYQSISRGTIGITIVTLSTPSQA